MSIEKEQNIEKALVFLVENGVEINSIIERYWREALLISSGLALKFKDIAVDSYFNVIGEFGLVDFQKIEPTDEGSAYCMRSENSTYQKGIIYGMEPDKLVVLIAGKVVSDE